MFYCSFWRQFSWIFSTTQQKHRIQPMCDRYNLPQHFEIQWNESAGLCIFRGSCARLICIWVPLIPTLRGIFALYTRGTPLKYNACRLWFIQLLLWGCCGPKYIGIKEKSIHLNGGISKHLRILIKNYRRPLNMLDTTEAQCHQMVP